MAFVDFEKAFDTVEHGALFDVVRDQGVPELYISILIKLYADQLAVVQADTLSRPFALSRGVKQGDPISSLLFIAIMEACFRELKTIWFHANSRRSGHGFGIVVDNIDEPMTNLRFAGDVMLVAQSKMDVAKMISHLEDTASKYGLKINYDKKVFGRCQRVMCTRRFQSMAVKWRYLHLRRVRSIWDAR